MKNDQKNSEVMSSGNQKRILLRRQPSIKKSFFTRLTTSGNLPPHLVNNATYQILVRKRALRKLNIAVDNSNNQNNKSNKKGKGKIIEENDFPVIKKKKVIRGSETIKLTKLKALHRYNICGWGWNSSNRSGNLTDENINFPRPVYKSNTVNYIHAAAAKNHSLFITEEGNIYTVGDGRKGQLGYGNMFTGVPLKGGILQGIPHPVTPTGELKFGRDLQCIQAAGGGTFSIAREATPEEGSAVVDGFVALENSIKRYLLMFPDSEAIKRAWCYVRHERFIINRKAEGLVISWGTGKHGELGLGEDTNYTPYPQVNFWLRKMSISHIAAGERHVLATDTNGFLYSWGYGRSGRLGHGDFEDRHRPDMVKYFANMFVVTCAAGDAHSAVLTTAREYSGDPLRKVLCFGRGAHGRLGNATNVNKNLPVQVKKWPLSAEGMQFQQIVCGGAHTVVLAYKQVKKCLAYPFGVITAVYSWGFGRNGQLGTGLMVDSFVPIKCHLPKSEIIVEVSAGRSWSMARGIGGNVYSWGKGLRGQLGQEEGHRFSLAPRELNPYASFLSIHSNYAHNVGITTPRKLYNLHRVEYLASKMGDLFNPFTVSKELLSFQHRQSTALYNKFYCCKRSSANKPFVLKNIARSLLEKQKKALMMTDVNQDKSKKNVGKGKQQQGILKQQLRINTTTTNMTSSTGKSPASNKHRNKAEFPTHEKMLEEFEEYRFHCWNCSLSNICYFCVQLCHKTHYTELIQKNSINYFYQKRNEENESLQHLPSMTENNNRPKTSNSLLMSRSGSMPNLANAYASQPTGILTVYRDKRKKRVITLQSPKDTPEEMNKRELILKTVPFDTSYQYFHGNTVFPRKLKAKHNELEYYPLNHIWQLPKISNLLPKPKFVPTTLQSPATPSGKKSPHRGVIARSPSKTLSRSSSSFKNRGKGMKRTSSNLDQEPSYRKMLLLAEREKVPNVPTTLGSFSSVGHLMTTLQDILDTDYRPLTKPPIPTCHCSLYSQHCRMLPNVGETLEEYLQVEEAKPSEIVVTRTSAQRRSSQLAKNTDSPTSETSTTTRPRRASLFSNLTLRRTSLTASPTPTAATSPREVEEPSSEELTTTMTIVKKKPKAAFLTEDILKVLELQKDLSYYNKYATIIQSIGRRYITRKEFILLKQEHILLRREICRRYVKQKLIAPIFQKVSREYAFYSEQREQRYMEYEDELMHRFNYYTKLQLSLLSMNAMAFAVKQMIGKVSIQLPMIEVLRKKKRKKKRNAIDFIEGSINDDRRDSLTNSVSSLPSFDPSRHRNSLTTASTLPHSHKGNASSAMKRKGSVPSATPSAPSTAKAKRRKSVTFDDESIEPSLKEEDEEDISLSIDGGDEESSLNEDDDSFLNPSKHYHHNNGLSLSDDDDEDDNDDDNNSNELIHWYPSYCFSYSSLRHQQALIHPKHRYSTEIIARLCRFYPVIPTRPATLPEGMFYDRDVYVLISRYIYQPREQEALAIFLQQRLKKRKEQEEIAQKAIQRLKKRQLSINLANNRLTIRQKNELMQNNLQEANKPLENPLLAILRQQRAGGGNNNTGEENSNPLFKNEWKEEMIFSRLLYPKKTLKHVINEATFSNFSLPPKQSKRRHVIPVNASPTSSIEGEDSMASAASFASFYKQQQETIEKDRQFLQTTAQQYSMSRRKRRKTLLNPERLFSRLCAMPEVLYNKNTLGRRYSLPDSFTSLYTKQLPILRQKKYYSQQREDIKRSIEFYEWKKQLLFQCQTNMFDYKKKREEYERNKDFIETKTTKTLKTSIKKNVKSPKRLNKDSGKTITTNDSDSITKDDESFVSAGSKKPSSLEGEQQQQQSKKKKLPDEVTQSYSTMYKSVTSLFQSSVLTPALPKEMNELLRNHSRRRTIGEPERLLTQLNSIMDIREFYHVNIMNIDKDFNIKRRRRSFDYTEERDIEMGILPQLDLSFEDDTEIILMHRLQRQSVEMDRRILKSGYLYDPEKEKEEEEEKAREAAEKEKEKEKEGVEEEKKMMSSGSSTQPSLSRPGTSQRPSMVQKPRKASVQPKNLSRTKKAAENKKAAGDNESLTIYSGEGDDNSSFAYSSVPNTTRSAMSTTTSEYVGRGVKGRVGGGLGGVVEVWQEHYTEDGLTYYYHPQTERSSWDRPEGESVQIQVMYLDESTGQQYWLNHSTGETYWLDGRVKE